MPVILKHFQFMWKHFKAYYFPIILFFSILSGGFTGYLLGPEAQIFKPLGDIFLNLLLTTIVPLVFFSVAASIARLNRQHSIGKMLLAMGVTFIATGIIAAIYMLIVVLLFPIPSINIPISSATPITQIHLSQALVSLVSVSDFSQLFSHNHMLAIILFAGLVGFACTILKDKSAPITALLCSGADVMLKVVTLIMYIAPIGFFAYFAVLVADIGPQLLTNYFHIALIYYPAALIYFIVAFTFYAYLAGGLKQIKLYWRNISIPMLTSLATCSSAASIPANLYATKQMGVAEQIYETGIPLGAVLHKDGSVLGAIIKIAFLFQLYHLSFSGPNVFVIAIFLAVLVGMIMGAIPGGGLLGEMLILSFYGFPSEALMMVAAISIIIDPIATMLNVTGDSVCCMLIEKIMHMRLLPRNKLIKIPS